MLSACEPHRLAHSGWRHQSLTLTPCYRRRQQERGANALSVAIGRGHVDIAEAVAEAGGVLGPKAPLSVAEAGLAFNSRSSK